MDDMLDNPILTIVLLLIGFGMAFLVWRDMNIRWTYAQICTEINWDSPSCKAEKERRLK